ncbi:alcohol dehydrogenase catalytic domain-containing protein [Halorutilales archaeon Cl-col2-1]
MEAVLFHEHGDLDVLSHEEVPVPEIDEDEVRIEVRATALNHLDLHIRRGIPTVDLDLPHIPGSDIAGVVDEVGDGVTDWEEGDRVVLNPSLSCGECEFCIQGEQSMCEEFEIIGEHVDGGYAEYAKAPAMNLIEIPDEYSFVDAAAAGLVYMTAWRMVSTRAELQSGEEVLVTGASGGVGSAAVQIADMIDAKVYATAGSEEKAEFVEEMGADVSINYKEEDVGDRIREETDNGVDVVLDSVGGEMWMDLLKGMKNGATLVTCGATAGWNPDAGLNYIFFNQLEVKGSTMSTLKEAREIMDLVFNSPDLEPVVDQVMPLEDAEEAQKTLEEGDHLGKIVLQP